LLREVDDVIKEIEDKEAEEAANTLKLEKEKALDQQGRKK